MMTRSKGQGESGGRSRAAIQLNTALDQRLLSYATAAAATGVGLLALGQTAQAKVIATAADIPIPPNHVVALDLNHDGIQDFFFFGSSWTTSREPTSLFIDPVRPNNRILGNNLYASALPAGVSVGPDGNFKQEHGFMFQNGATYPHGFESRGPWKGTQESYLGVKLFIQGEVHYGWVRVSVNATKYPLSASVTGYAYETEPNTPILTGHASGSDETGQSGQPGLIPSSSSALASLGALASGSVGLVADARKPR